MSTSTDCKNHCASSVGRWALTSRSVRHGLRSHLEERRGRRFAVAEVSGAVLPRDLQVPRERGGHSEQASQPGGSECRGVCPCLRVVVARNGPRFVDHCEGWHSQQHLHRLTGHLSGFRGGGLAGGGCSSVAPGLTGAASRALTLAHRPARLSEGPQACTEARALNKRRTESIYNLRLGLVSI